MFCDDGTMIYSDDIVFWMYDNGMLWCCDEFSNVLDILCVVVIFMSRIDEFGMILMDW